MSHVQEFTLTGKQTTVAGVTKLINRHLRGTTLRRIEVRYSTQVSPPFQQEASQSQIAALLREHGVTNVSVSVRHTEVAIDDAAGEHRVRMIHEQREPSGFGSLFGVGPSFPGWLVRLVPGRRSPAPDAGPADAPLAQQPPAARQPPAGPAVTERRATELLSQALTLALRGEGPTLDDEPIQGLRVIVRHPDVHFALGALLSRDPSGSSVWAARALAKHKRTAVAAPHIAYDYQPPQRGEHTEVVGGADIEVQLLRTPPAAATAPAPDRDTSARPAVPHLLHKRVDPSHATALPIEGATHDGTLLPATSPPPAALTVRVLGTTERNFDHPFELRFDRLPATFDRQALERGGFAARHGASLRVASQSSPLVIDRDGVGGLVVTAAARPGTNRLPMYFRADTHAGVVGTQSLHAQSERLVVNGPMPLVDPVNGGCLHPLVVELALAN